MRRMGQRLGLATLLVSAVALTGMPQSAADHDEVAATVRLGAAKPDDDDWRFRPAEVTVKPGEKVRWARPDVDRRDQPRSDRHSITFEDYYDDRGRPFDTVIWPGEQVDLRFDLPGDSGDPNRPTEHLYHYYCGFHRSAGMTGVVRVVAASEPEPQPEPEPSPPQEPEPTMPPTTATTAPPATSPPPTAPAAPPTTSSPAPPAGTPPPAVTSPAPPTSTHQPAPTTATTRPNGARGGNGSGRTPGGSGNAAETTSTTADPDTEVLGETDEFFFPELDPTPPAPPAAAPADEIDPAAFAGVAGPEGGSRQGSTTARAVAAAAGGTLLALVGWAWYHRSSRYLPA